MRDSVRAAGDDQPARGPDQQRDLRLHRRSPSSSSPSRGSAPSSTAGPSCTSRPSESPGSSPPTGRSPTDRAVHAPTGCRARCCAPSGPRRTAGRRPGVGRRGRAAPARGREHAGRPERYGFANPDPSRPRPRTDDADRDARPPLRRVAVLIPTYNERDNLPVIVAPGARPSSRTSTSSSLDDNSPDGTGELADAPRGRRPPGARAAPPRQGRPRRGLPRRLRLGPGRRLRRRRRDGRRRLAPARAPADPARARAADADVVIGSPLRARWLVVNWPRHRKALPRRQPLHPADARHPGQRRHRRLPRLPQRRAGRDSASTTSPPRATASRSTSPGAPSAPACASSRCRSPSSSGRTATRR